MRKWLIAVLVSLGGALTAHAQLDVAVKRIETPADTVGLNVRVIPSAWFINAGGVPASFPVRFQIGTAYQNWDTVANLLPGDSQFVTFNAWVAQPIGQYAVTCSTELANDINPGNDARHQALMVVVRDASAENLTAPRDTVDSGAVVSPSATVANHGSIPATFPVFLTIGSTYADTQQVVELQPGTSLAVDFRSYTCSERGMLIARCSTALAGDMSPYNNYFINLFIGRVRDVGVGEVVAPIGVHPETTLVIPSVSFADFGTTDETFQGYIAICLGPDTLYQDSQEVYLSAGRSDVASFTPWLTPAAGTYQVFAYTRLDGDQNPLNDTMSAVLYIRNIPAGWTAHEQMPPGVKNKGIKTGGSLCFAPNNRLYAFKGGSLNEFYSFNTETEQWTTLCSIPYGSAGRKKAGKGAALAYAPSSGLVYALKGNNTPEFWTYDPATNNWLEKKPISGVPKVKGGAALCYVPSRNFIYALKGSKTREVWAYSIAGDEWLTRDTIDNMPPPNKIRAVRDGGALTLAVKGQDSLLYAFKGGNTREFWAYSISGDSWFYVDSVPYDTVKKTKVKAGAALAWNGQDRVYAFKGGKTFEFLAYDFDESPPIWRRMPYVPGLIKVKEGGSLCRAGNLIFALKGNKSRELLSYYESNTSGIAEPPPAFLPVRTGPLVVPSISTGFFSIRCPAPSGLSAQIQIYTSLGRQVRVFRIPQSPVPATVSLTWDGTDSKGRVLANGIYLVRLVDRGGSGPVSKIVLQK